MRMLVQSRDYLENILEDIRRSAKYPLRIEYETVKQLKTKSQLGFIFGGLIGVLRQYFYDTQGEVWEVNDLKVMLYYEAGVLSKKRYPNGMEYECVTTLSQMSKFEASEFITKVLYYMECLPDLVIPPDLRNCWLLHVTESEIRVACKSRLLERCTLYLAYQRSLSCLHCGSFKNIEAHHMRLGYYAGISNKPPDWYTIALCHRCHEGVHRNGQDDLIAGLPLYGFSIEIYCRLAFLKWLNKR